MLLSSWVSMKEQDKACYTIRTVVVTFQVTVVW